MLPRLVNPELFDFRILNHMLKAASMVAIWMRGYE
ncbi:hypothetical protein BvCmsA77A_03599 [Escherichia coli]|nr:hypothetical protein BvCmsA77A_03599 [Escherichia coli]